MPGVGLTSQRCHVVGEVFLPSAEAVHQQQPGTLAGDLDREIDTIVHRDAHAHMVTRTGPAAPDAPKSGRGVPRRLALMPAEPAAVRRSGAFNRFALAI